ALDADEVRTYWLTSLRDEIRRRLREAKVGFGGLALVDNVMQVRLSNPEDADRAVRALGDLAPIAPIGLLERTLAVARGSLESGKAEPSPFGRLRGASIDAWVWRWTTHWLSLSGGWMGWGSLRALRVAGGTKFMSMRPVCRLPPH